MMNILILYFLGRHPQAFLNSDLSRLFRQNQFEKKERRENRDDQYHSSQTPDQFFKLSDRVSQRLRDILFNPSDSRIMKYPRIISAFQTNQTGIGIVFKINGNHVPQHILRIEESSALGSFSAIGNVLI